MTGSRQSLRNGDELLTVRRTNSPLYRRRRWGGVGGGVDEAISSRPPPAPSANPSRGVSLGSSARSQVGRAPLPPPTSARRLHRRLLLPASQACCGGGRRYPPHPATGSV